MRGGDVCDSGCEGVDEWGKGDRLDKIEMG